MYICVQLDGRPVAASNPRRPQFNSENQPYLGRTIIFSANFTYLLRQRKRLRMANEKLECTYGESGKHKLCYKCLFVRKRETIVCEGESG